MPMQTRVVIPKAKVSVVSFGPVHAPTFEARYVDDSKGPYECPRFLGSSESEAVGELQCFYEGNPELIRVK